MNTESTKHRPEKAAIGPEGIPYPIEFLFTEHDRQRVVCAALERVADDCTAEDAQENAAFALNYLENELPLHIADEEEDLFPLLKRRCTADDDIDTILALLNEEHEVDRNYHLKLLEPLRSIAAGLNAADAVDLAREAGAFAIYSRAFAIFQRRHLAWENGTVLPLARKRLSEADQADLGRKMAARRRSPIAD